MYTQSEIKTKNIQAKYSFYGSRNMIGYRIRPGRLDPTLDSGEKHHFSSQQWSTMVGSLDNEPKLTPIKVLNPALRNSRNIFTQKKWKNFILTLSFTPFKPYIFIWFVLIKRHYFSCS